MTEENSFFVVALIWVAVVECNYKPVLNFIQKTSMKCLENLRLVGQIPGQIVGHISKNDVKIIAGNCRYSGDIGLDDMPLRIPIEAQDHSRTWASIGILKGIIKPIIAALAAVSCR